MKITKGLFELFGENKNAKKDFFNWCKDSEELCEYDLELLENDLFLPILDNSVKYFYLNRGSILDWLELRGYYIELRVFSNRQFIANVLRDDFYYFSPTAKRIEAIEFAIQKSIEDYETKQF